MRPESVAWERAAEVREAAERWLRAGAIGPSTHDAIRKAYHDPCVTPTLVWRILTAAMVSAVILCVTAALALGIQPGAMGSALLLFVLAAAALLLTERLEASPGSARRGAAGATAFWGGLFFSVGLWLFLREGQSVPYEPALDIALVASALVWAAGGWRWGHSLFAGLSALSLFVFFSRLSTGRALWILAGAALAGLFARRSDDPAWAPSHRRAAQVLLVAGVASVYGAINVYSLDEGIIQRFWISTPVRVPPPPSRLVLAAVATAALPLLVLVWGFKSRRVVLLDTGIVLLVLSLSTLRHYVHVAPLWVVLTASGASLVVLAVAVERALRRSPGSERWGFTADALFSDERRQQVLQTIPVAAAFTPAAHITPRQEPGFAGRGGAFGGGGASEEF